MLRLIKLGGLAALAILLLPATSWTAPDGADRNPDPVPMSRYQGGQVSDGATIGGTVTLSGEIPDAEPREIPGDFHSGCGAHQTPDETAVVDPDSGAVANAVVYLADIESGKAMPRGEEVVLDQEGCQYRPHVLVAPRGSTLRIVNSDETLHNVHFVMANRGRDVLNAGMPAGAGDIEFPLRRPGLILAGCDVHPWMKSYILATLHPYYAVTGEDGSFELADVPAGSYTLRLWHERFEGVEREVEVDADGTLDLDLALSP